MFVFIYSPHTQYLVSDGSPCLNFWRIFCANASNAQTEQECENGKLHFKLVTLYFRLIVALKLIFWMEWAMVFISFGKKRVSKRIIITVDKIWLIRINKSIAHRFYFDQLSISKNQSTCFCLYCKRSILFVSPNDDKFTEKFHEILITHISAFDAMNTTKYCHCDSPGFPESGHGFATVFRTQF